MSNNRLLLMLTPVEYCARVSVTDIVSFILRVRNHHYANLYPDDSPDELEQGVALAIAQGSIVVDSDSFGRVHGVVIATPTEWNRSLLVSGLFSVRRGSLRKFALWMAQSRFAGWTITATRYGRGVSYGGETEKLIRRLSRKLCILYLYRRKMEH